jgi:peroxiredoxin
MIVSRIAALLMLALLVVPAGALAQDGFDPGLGVGDTIPQFDLRDQDGVIQNFDSLKGSNGLAILFFRSADWCPFCKTSLAQYEEDRAGFEARGLNLVGVSYDSTETLKAFGDRIGIGYRMLTDEGSQLIREVGILNEDVPADSSQFGIPHPGLYIVDNDQTIVSKYFETSFRERFTPATVLTREFGDAGGRETELTNEHLTLTTSLSRDEGSVGHRITMVADVRLPDRMHLYAPGVEGYTPVTFKIDETEAVRLYSAEYPEPEILFLEVIDESVPVYNDTVRFTREFTITTRDAGPIELTGTFGYQACNDVVCYIPTEVPISFTLDTVPMDSVRVQ